MFLPKIKDIDKSYCGFVYTCELEGKILFFHLRPLKIIFIDTRQLVTVSLNNFLK